MASGVGGFITPVARFFSEKIGILYAYDFWTLVLKFYWLTFKKIQGSSCSRELSSDLLLTGVKRKFAIYRFLEHISEFSIFFYKIFMVARFDRVLATLIRSLLISALVGLKTRLKAFFEAVRFDRNLWPMKMIFLLKFSLIYVLSCDVKEFFVAATIKSKIITTQTRFSKILAKSALVWPLGNVHILCQQSRGEGES